ncbi:MAG: Coproporphyrinogen III oxidase [Promethearchaeota archaeon]|nr:MAG: Coproporphyrinogen III oxidase [Candidatus Lokiarchaeota archaeon]
MKIALINPSPLKPDDTQEGKETFFYVSSPPLGVLYLATCLQEEGYDVMVLDQAAVNFSNEEVITWVKQRDFDLVGFSILCISFENAKLISKRLKEWNPNLIIVFGNYLATFYPEKILSYYEWVDFCVRGEGEKTFVELVETLETNKALNLVDGISYRDHSRIKKNKDRAFIKNLDTIPFPDRSLVPDVYKNRIGKIDISPRRFTTIVTSRGCPYSCNFCGCSAFSHGMWRTRSVENIFEEISFLAAQGYREILIVDDNFTLSPKRVFELCSKIKKENLDIAFICDGRVNKSSYELLSSMAQANFEIIMYGIESGNQRILDIYNKKITPQMSRQAIKNARNAGFQIIIGSFMIGALEETYEEAINTLKFSASLDIDFPYILFTRALPGTQLFKSLIQKQIIKEEQYWETGVDIIDLPQAKMKREVIFKIIEDQFHIFFFRPKYLIKALLRTITSKYRREIMLNHLSIKDFDKFIKLINNPPGLF